MKITKFVLLILLCFPLNITSQILGVEANIVCDLVKNVPLLFTSISNICPSVNLFICPPITNVLSKVLLCSLLGETLVGLNLSSYSIGSIPTQIGQLSSLTLLDMSSSGASGIIPTQIGLLNSLLYLNLSNNPNIMGTIPTQLGQLNSLQFLDLSNIPNIIGTIPTQLGQLNSLQSLSIENNFLSGMLPKQFGILTKITNLRLSINLLSGTLPTEIGLCTSLQYLDLSTNQFGGTIPTQLGKLSKISILLANSNSISGTIPTEFGILTYLSDLELDSNQLSGTLPTLLGYLSALTTLTLSGNLISGTVPSQISNLALLIDLDLSTNQLSGTLPTQLGNLLYLQELELNTNSFEGILPTQIGLMTSLTNLLLYGNQINGIIPTQLGKLSLCQWLDIGFNKLSGPLPKQLGLLRKLTRLILSGNQLNGTIPTQIGDLTSLQRLDLSVNQLNASIPTQLGNLTSLIDLSLSDNLLFGTIPTQFGQMSALNILFLPQNSLNGSIPLQLMNLENLELLILDHNSLTGIFYSEILSPGFFVSQRENTVRVLSLSYNNLVDITSYSRRNIHGLIVTEIVEEINISNNNLTQLPLNIANSLMSSLLTLDLSYNSIDGTLPIINANKLIKLDISYNLITGSLPIFNTMYSLENLNLEKNQFIGTIPELKNSLPNLLNLYLNDNNLSGSLPDFPLGLRELYLQNNQVNGTIPSQMGDLTVMTIMDFSGLYLCGCFPPSWKNKVWVTCLLFNMSYNCNCSFAPNCNIQPCDPTVVCGIDPCATGDNICANRDCIPKKTAGYSCGNCPPGFTSYGDYECLFQGGPVGPTVPITSWIVPIVIALILSVLFGVLQWRKYCQSRLKIDLPPDWYWNHGRITFDKYKSSYSDPVYFYKRVLENSKEQQFLNQLKEILDFGPILVEEAYALNCPVLANNLTNRRQIQKSRMKTNSEQFLSQSWKSLPDAELRQKTIDQFNSKIEAWSWNKDLQIQDNPVLPVVHGTDESIAWKIASGGFAALSVLDSGYFGKGIYFSTSALYTVPYFLTRKKPTIMICFVIPGNPYPVIEDPDDKDSFVGRSIVSGYQSHYIVVKKNGRPFMENDYGTEKPYDELVFDQESQVVPVFLLKINTENESQVVKEFQRKIPTNLI